MKVENESIKILFLKNVCSKLKITEMHFWNKIFTQYCSSCYDIEIFIVSRITIFDWTEMNQ